VQKTCDDSCTILYNSGPFLLLPLQSEIKVPKEESNEDDEKAIFSRLLQNREISTPVACNFPIDDSLFWLKVQKAFVSGGHQILERWRFIHSEIAHGQSFAVNSLAPRYLCWSSIAPSADFTLFDLCGLRPSPFAFLFLPIVVAIGLGAGEKRRRMRQL